MKNIFSLSATELLSNGSVTPAGDGMFFLYQTDGFSEITHNGEKSTLTVDEIFCGDVKKSYTVRLADNNVGKAIIITAEGELVKNLSELYRIDDGFSVKAPEARELFEELCLIPLENFSSETEKSTRSALVLHRLLSTLHRSVGTRLVRRTALRIKDYIDTHVSEKILLEDLSKVFFMSKTHIHRLFKEEYGVSPIRYLTSCKTEAAKRLLRNDSLKLSDIAEALSFSDAKHFSKTFLKLEGMLPSEYQKKIKKQAEKNHELP